jgi:DNA-binding response OmpR family regulator
MLRARVAKKDIWIGRERLASFAAMSAAVLVAEPEPTTRGFLERHLSDDGFHVVGSGPDMEALELVERARPDLVLGTFELCRRLRETEPGGTWSRDVPVIVLGGTAEDAVDRLRAFERGCDDYLGRPFQYEELLARIRAVLRRAAAPHRERLTAGGIVVDRATRRVTVDGSTVVLSGKEYELLVRLAQEPARVFTKEELLRDVWGYRSKGRTRTLDSHASRLRRKLGPRGAGPYVVNVWGVGYRLLED